MAKTLPRAGLAVRLSGGLIRAYQVVLSPFLGGNCRYEPTCSHYAWGALQTHGFFRGWWLAIRRLLRCHPFHPGGYDPVPPAHKQDS